MTSTSSPALPKYAQVARELRERIHAGELAPGDRLPSYAEMRAQGISQPTLDRVHVELEREGLIVREHGRGVFVARRRRKTGVIGFNGAMACSTRGLRSAYWGPLVEGMQDAVHVAGYELLLLNAESQVHWDRMDGVLFSLGYAASLYRRLPAGMPFVSLIMEWSGAPSVLSDEYEAMLAMTRHLIGLGHRRIALFSASEGGYSAERYRAYRDALCQAGITPDPRWRRVLHNPGSSTPANFEAAGELCMRQWLETDWAELGCTAIMAYNDDNARGVMRALARCGLTVPRDVSVTGFDGLPAPPGVPPLSTVAVNLAHMGQCGVKALLEWIGSGVQPGNVLVPAVFVAGDTTAAPRSGGTA